MSRSLRAVPWLVTGVAAAVATHSVAAAPDADPRQQQFTLAAAGAIKVTVRGQGWLRVEQPALVAAGLDPGVDPANLRLFADGVEQAMAITGNGDGLFAATEALEFYGAGRDTLWSDTRTYWLTVGAAGARVTVVSPPAGSAPPASFTHTARLVEHKNYLAAIKNGDASNFFGAVVGSTPTTQTITVRHLDTGLPAQAMLRVSLQGVTKTAHQVNVSLNGQLAGTCALDLQATATFPFPAAGLVEGDNVVTLMSGSASDFSVVVSVEIDYAHTYVADDDALLLPAPAAATRLTITGFTSPAVRVVDITDPSHPVELAVTVSTSGATSAARVDTSAGTGPRTLYAFADRRVGKPVAVVRDQPSMWAQSHDGELVILSHAQFLDSLRPLVERRTQESWAVQLLDLQDVYDEFGGGDKTIVAIRDFLQYAQTHWRRAPRYVLLVGDATFDPRNFSGKGDSDFAPTKLIDTQEMETVSDDWFVDFDQDSVPELAIGRFPVRTREEAAAVVQKTLGYAGLADLSRGGLFVTDQNGVDLDFETASAQAEVKVSDLMPIDHFQRGQPGSMPATLLQKLNDGPFLVNYLGHGSVEVWDGLLSSAQAKSLTNSHTSVYVIMNCLNGFFHDLYTESLAEALLKAPQGGAAAVWASSALAEFGPQPTFNQEFLRRLTRTSIGETAMAAKQAITDLEARKTWILFGDPTLFGSPRALADAGAPEADAGAADVGATDAGAGTRDAAPATDAGAPSPIDAMVPVDASSSLLDAGAEPNGPDAADARADRGVPAPDGGGCGCHIDGASPAAGASTLMLLACLAAARGRRGRRPGRLGLAGRFSGPAR